MHTLYDILASFSLDVCMHVCMYVHACADPAASASRTKGRKVIPPMQGISTSGMRTPSSSSYDHMYICKYKYMYICMNFNHVIIAHVYVVGADGLLGKGDQILVVAVIAHLVCTPLHRAAPAERHPFNSKWNF